MNLARANALFGTAGLIALVIFVFAFGSFYTVDEGERGVVTRYGKIVKVSQPGLGFRLPLLDSVTKISIQDHVEIYSDMEAYSRDQQPAIMRVSVSYRLLADQVADRSEERRVGKECRSRGSPYH